MTTTTTRLIAKGFLSVCEEFCSFFFYFWGWVISVFRPSWKKATQHLCLCVSESFQRATKTKNGQHKKMIFFVFFTRPHPMNSCFTFHIHLRIRRWLLLLSSFVFPCDVKFSNWISQQFDPIWGENQVKPFSLSSPPPSASLRYTSCNNSNPRK